MTKIREIVDAQSTHTLEPSEDHTESVADFGEEFLSTLQPIIRFQGLISAFHKPIVQLPKFDFSVSRVFNCHRRLATNLRNSSLGPVTEFSRKLEKLRRHNDVLDKSGWLPHYSTPFGLVDDCDTDSEALHRRLLHFYEERWSEVRQEIEFRLAGYELDDEAKATFREALDAHESRLYRCVCRVLPPEIERIARIELHDHKGKKKSSQPELGKLAGTLPVSSIKPRGFRALNLLRRLENHLYKSVRPDKDLYRFEQDPVPNRHAAVHGLVVYSSPQNSLNSIFMTEYIFQVISALKKTARLPAAD